MLVRCSGPYRWHSIAGGANVEKRGAPIVYVMDDDADVRDGLNAPFESVGCERVINPLVNLGRERRNQHPDEHFDVAPFTVSQPTQDSELS